MKFTHKTVRVHLSIRENKTVKTKLLINNSYKDNVSMAIILKQAFISADSIHRNLWLMVKIGLIQSKNKEKMSLIISK